VNINKSDIRALADRVTEKLLADYVIKKVLGDMIPIPREHCPRRRDFSEDIAREIEVFFGK
jgi:hypothetical protein